MGDVGGGRDRAQMILLTGFAIAIALVALVMLLNTMIYTQNLATREVDIGGSDALEAERTVRVATGGIMDRENDRDYGSYGSLTDTVTENVSGVEDVIREPVVRRSRVLDVDESGMTYDEGRLVKDTNESRAFTNASGVSDWTMAVNIEQTRGFEAVVGRASLTSTSTPDSDGAFRVRLAENGSTDTWSVYVYRDGGGSVAVATATNGSGITEHCTFTTDTAVVDLTLGTVNGTECSGYRWAESIDGSYDVQIRDGVNATGTYGVTFNTSVSGVVNTGSVDDGPSDSPYFVSAVYSAQVPVTFETSRVRYENTIRVAPGEPDE